MFTDKNVVITGGGNGIGLATASKFSALNANVIVIDKDENASKNCLDKITVIKADVSEPGEVNDAFATIKQQLGGVDILIANAGISYRNRFLDITLEQWQKVMQTNLNGVFYCMQNAAKQMLSKEQGSIIVTASTNGITAHPYYADYNASKAALISLVKTVAVELAPNIRVNGVAPGYVLTQMQLNEYTPEMIAAINHQLPLKRHGQPEEIADLFVFLASDHAKYITGQVIVIDGGEIC